PVPPGRTRSSYNNNKYSNHTARYYRGPSAELLAAFLFMHRDVAGMPFSMKVGRLTKVWGPGLLTGAFEVSVFQNPTNLRKSLLQPGSTVSALFLPVGQVDMSLVITPRFSVSAQWFFEYG